MKSTTMLFAMVLMLAVVSLPAYAGCGFGCNVESIGYGLERVGYSAQSVMYGAGVIIDARTRSKDADTRRIDVIQGRENERLEIENRRQVEERRMNSEERIALERERTMQNESNNRAMVELASKTADANADSITVGKTRDGGMTASVKRPAIVRVECDGPKNCWPVK